MVPTLQGHDPKALPHRCQRTTAGKVSRHRQMPFPHCPNGKVKGQGGKEFFQGHMEYVAKLEPELPPVNISHGFPLAGGDNTLLCASGRIACALLTTLITSSPCTKLTRQRTLRVCPHPKQGASGVLNVDHERGKVLAAPECSFVCSA